MPCTPRWPARPRARPGSAGPDPQDPARQASAGLASALERCERSSAAASSGLAAAQSELEALQALVRGAPPGNSEWMQARAPTTRPRVAAPARAKVPAQA